MVANFITEKSLREKLQECYNDVKDYLDDGKITNSTGANNVTVSTDTIKTW